MTASSTTDSFAPLQNSTFLRACLRQATDHTPVWLMRQAGRYLPEYRATRAKAGSFMGLATNTDYATEVTLQPLERYPLDAAILFSDILTVPDAMGLGLSFAWAKARSLPNGARRGRRGALAVPDMDKLRYVFDAVTSIRKALNGRVPLIGFSGSPWTLACYMVEGAGSDDYRHGQVHDVQPPRPDAPHPGHQRRCRGAYLNAQIDAGAQAVMVFDSWGGVLADGNFQAFSLAYTARVLAQAQARTRRRAHPAHRLHQGRRLWLERDGPARLRGAGPGLDRQPRPRARRWAARPAGRARRCRATSTRMCCLPTRNRSRPKWQALESFGTPHQAPAGRPGPGRSDPYLQPRDTASASTLLLKT
jgi:uroporphyrinogen decarboxylase